MLLYDGYQLLEESDQVVPVAGVEVPEGTVVELPGMMRVPGVIVVDAGRIGEIGVAGAMIWLAIGELP